MDASQGHIVPISELPDFRVTADDPDVRGWEVVTSDGRGLGTVRDLLVDRDAMRVRYLEVELAGGGRTRLPVEAARPDATASRVVYDTVPAERPVGGPAYDRAQPAPESVQAPRATPVRATEERTITRHEEELAVGTRSVQTGEVEVSKRVETHHVAQPVTTQREDVVVERRPVDAGQAASLTPTVGEDEIRVPIVEEEIVVERRPVVREEVVIRKETEQQTRTVEADLRKERVEVDERTTRDDDRAR